MEYAFSVHQDVQKPRQFRFYFLFEKNKNRK